jgi:formylglycine-generating enzyme required for sulfatase activity
MKNPVIAAGVFLLAALGLVAALTLTARTNSGSAETASQTVSPNSSVTSTAADALPGVKPPVVSEDPRFKGMVWIPPGKFLMGEIDTVPDEFPPHEVELDGFWMDSYRSNERRVQSLRR